MQPRNLYLKGFRGVVSACGKNEITIDFRSLLQDSDRLVALVGPNGSGKSTILDNLHPYPVMPSRLDADGPVNPDAFSYYDHLVGHDCEKVLEWSMGDTLYRTTQHWKINGTRSAEFYLHVWNEAQGQWHPVVLPDGTLSDGKTSTYGKCVEGICGPASLFFTSGFSAQGKTPLARFKTGDIKELMSELLGHDEVRAAHAAATVVVTGLKRELAASREGLADLEVIAKEVERSEQDALRASAKIASYRTAAGDSRAKVDEAIKAATQVEERAASMKAVVDETNRLTEERKLVVDVASKDVAQIDADVAGEQKRSASQVGEIAFRKLALNRERASLSTRATEITQTLAREPALAAAEQMLPDLQGKVEASRVARENAEVRVAKLRALEVQKREAEVALEATGRELNVSDKERVQLELRSALTNEVPCQGTDLQAGCKLLGDAVSAKANIPTMVSQHGTLTLKFDQQKATLGSLVAAIGPVSDADESLRVAKVDEAAANRALLEANTVIALKPMIEAAKSEQGQVETRLTENAASVVTLDAQMATESSLLISRVEDLHKRKADRTALRDETLSRLDEALKALPPVLGAGDIAAAQATVQQAKAALATVETQLSNAISEEANARSQFQTLSPQAARVPAFKVRIKAIEEELASWTLLTKGLGNDGIIALSIDDAGPMLSDTANDLLENCYGPQYQVAITTQTEKKSGGMKEGFEILVHDTASGDVKPLRLMSGGQKVWINECLSRALALFLASANDTSYETLFSDESDGPLDPERKRMFMMLKRRVLDTGGYKREFFISQTPEIVESADAQVDIPALLAA
ncbi:MAG: AAA family ATPase [Betaproteobacteria bacterium]|jgi:exonuclease SbcC|nr:AAA family ATPase [Betaproteobacteria bacterium]